MKIIICGAGVVGSSIGRQLTGEGNDVTIVDQDPERIRKVNETLDVQALEGFASHPDVLEKAGAADAEMLIAVTQSDEVNMIACQIGASLFNIPLKIARIRTQSYLDPLWKDLYRSTHLPIDVIISPEQEVAQAVVRRLHLPGAVDMVPFAEGRVRLVGVRCMLDCPLINQPIHQIVRQAPDLRLSVVGLHRNNRFLLARPEERLFPGDDVYFLADARDVRHAMALFGHEEKEARRLIILGGGNIGLFLAQALEVEGHGVKVRLIEVTKERAEYVAEHVRAGTVIHGDGLDQEILQEASVAHAETIVAVTNDDEVNILGSLLAKRNGCQRAITLVNNLSYAPLIGHLGIDVVLNPRETTVSSILQHVRRGRIMRVHSLHDGVAEVIEAEVMETSPLIGRTVEDLELPMGVQLGMITREHEVVMPTPETVIRHRDHLILLSLAGMVRQVEDIFSIRGGFF